MNYYLDGKKVLLIVPKFHEYEKEICMEMQRQGADVNIIYENLESISMFYRFVYVYLKKAKKIIQTIYYLIKINELKNEFDIIFVIRGMSLTQRVIECLKNKYRNAKFILYQWDSINRNPNAIYISKYFDKVLTFDFVDSNKMGWKYRPLFFVKERIDKKEYDLCFIGTLHTDRLQICNKIKNFSEEQNIKSFTYLYIRKLIYYKNLLFFTRNNQYRNINKEIIHFKPISLELSNVISSRSKVIVDYADPKQTGLTMRTIEALGNHCKIVTNNYRIKDEPFYSEDNIYIYQGTNVQVPYDFLHSEYKDIDTKILSRYTIAEWLEEILINE